MIPHSGKHIFIEIMKIFGEKLSQFPLFVEIAIPTFLQCFVSPEKRGHVNLCTNGRNDLDYYSKSCPTNTTTLIHPLKFTTFEHVDYMIKFMDLDNKFKVTYSEALWSLFDKVDFDI
jgi:hypothetical protein